MSNKDLPSLDIPSSSSRPRIHNKREQYSAIFVPSGDDDNGNKQSANRVAKDYSHIPKGKTSSSNIALILLAVIIFIVSLSLLLLSAALWTHPAWQKDIAKRLPKTLLLFNKEKEAAVAVHSVAADFQLHVPDNYDPDHKYKSKQRKVPWIPGFRGAKHGTEEVQMRDGTKRMVTWSVISETHPRALIINGTLTPEEASSVIRTAQNSLERSRVISGNHGENALNSVRTSSGTFFISNEDVHLPANQALRAVVGAIGGVPADDWIEATQVLEYKAGQKYVPHPDFYSDGDEANLNRGGQRIYTVLTWLNEVPGGGETTFPNAQLKVRPQAFNSIMFYNTDEHGNVDFGSIHSGEPPTEGSTKYVAVNWVHGMPFV